MIKSNCLFLVLAQIIESNLKDEKGSFGPVLMASRQKGKGEAAERTLAFSNASTHPLFHGKATTSKTLKGWIQECKVAGEAEMKRREQVEGPGRRDGTEDNVPELLRYGVTCWYRGKSILKQLQRHIGIKILLIL